MNKAPEKLLPQYHYSLVTIIFPTGTGRASIYLALLIPFLLTEVIQYHHYPSYKGFDGCHRGGFLRWMAGGRIDPCEPAYAFLVLYGVEDRAQTPGADDIPASIAELERLAGLLPGCDSFCRYTRAIKEYALACRLISWEAFRSDGRIRPEAVRLKCLLMPLLASRTCHPSARYAQKEMPAASQNTAELPRLPCQTTAFSGKRYETQH